MDDLARAGVTRGDRTLRAPGELLRMTLTEAGALDRRGWMDVVPEVVPGFPDRLVPKNIKAAAILKKRTLTRPKRTPREAKASRRSLWRSKFSQKH